MRKNTLFAALAGAFAVDALPDGGGDRNGLAQGDSPGPRVSKRTWDPHAGPVATLVPALPWNTDSSDIHNLNPRNNSQIYFTEDGYADPHTPHLFALMDATTNYPSVVLDHSKYVSTVSCGNDGINLTFSHPQARSHAEKVWDRDFVLITSSIGCGVATPDGQPSYWLVKEAQFPPDSTLAFLKAVEVAIQHALDDVLLSWGTHVPNKDRDGQPGYPGGPPEGPEERHHTKTVVETVTKCASGCSSSSSSGPTPTTCGTPPAPTISGFPAVACSDDFDRRLNDVLGYYDFDDQNFSESLKEVAPGFNNTNVDDYQLDDIRYDYNSRRRALSHALAARSTLRRRFSFTSFFQSAADVVSDAASAVADTVTNVAQQAVDTVSGAADATANIVNDAIDSLTSTSIDTNIPIQLGPGDEVLVDSNFGPAYQIFHDEETPGENSSFSATLDIFCVGCGIQGNAHVSGQIMFSLSTLSLNQGSISLDGSLVASLGIGITAQAQFENTVKKTIVDTGAPGFSIPDVITIGPVVTLDAEVTFNLQATGDLLFEATASFPAYHATIDLVNSNNDDTSGFTPVFNAGFDADGQIEASLRLGTPLTIGLGLEIPPIDFMEVLAVTNEPFVEASATFDTASDTCPNGVEADLQLGDDLTADIFSLTTLTLFQGIALETSACFPLGGGGRRLMPRDEPDLLGFTTYPVDHTVTVTETSSSTQSLSTSTTYSTTRTLSTSTTSSTTRSISTSTTSSTTRSISTSTTSSTTRTLSTSTTSSTTRTLPTSTTYSSTRTSSTRTLPTISTSSTSRTSSTTATTASTASPYGPDGWMDFDELSNRVKQAVDEQNANADKTNANGYQGHHVTDYTGRWHLAGRQDGTLNLQAVGDRDGGLIFYSIYDIVLADSANRMLYYFPDTMDALGVSRFRLGAFNGEVPKTSECIALYPVEYDSSPATANVLVALDTVGRSYWTVACNIDGKSNKLFLIDDLEKGLKKLESEELRYIVTGGVTTDCAVVALYNDFNISN